MSNFCVFYRDNFKYLDEVSEININYAQQPIMLLVTFLEAHPDKIINIFIDDAEYFVNNKLWECFFTLQNQANLPKFRLVLKDNEQEFEKKIYEALTADPDKKVDYFFNKYINNWDTLTYYLSLHPTDVYIVEGLCFEMEQVKRLTEKYNCRIRCFPNIAQSVCDFIPDIKKFFIRPEDIKLYSTWVDVFEIWDKLKSINTIYKVYVKDQKWFGELGELISFFSEEKVVDNRCIDSIFGLRRSNCGKRCMKGRPCKVCEATKLLADILEKNDLILKTKD